jgi:hypothetical protein
MMRFICYLLLSLSVSACASTKFNVLEINSLSAEASGEGEFEGLEYLAKRAPRTDVKRVNIIFLHGIGWVENREDKPLANSFIQGVATAYNLETPEKAVSSLCGRDENDEDKSALNHILIEESDPKIYNTSIPGRNLELSTLVCMDKQVMPVGNDLEYVIYRIFWDELMWDSLQYAHVGQDDSNGESSSFAALRKGVNRSLKDKLVNFGFSDAVMYLGPAGNEIRSAIRGAMCAASLDAAGVSFSNLGHKINYDRACELANGTTIETDPFAFVAESLGSKIALDLIREVMTDNQETVHDAMIRSTQVFMLANQIPLLSLSDISRNDPFKPSNYNATERPTFVAFSEINDFLTYELVPFYEQLYKNSKIDPDHVGPRFDTFDRRRLVETLGFNVIDMRVEFAQPLIPLVKSFVDPLFAHNGHVQQPRIMEYMLCGARGRDVKIDGCGVIFTNKK